MKNQKLTHVEMNFISSLVNAGASPKEAFAMLYGNYAVEKPTFHKESREKVVSSYSKKDTKSKDLSKKDKSLSTRKTSKGSKKPAELKKGDFVKVINLKTKAITTFGKITKVGKDSFYLNGAKKTSYSKNNCFKITKKEFGNLKNSSKKNSKKDIAISNNKKTLPLWYYTIALAYIADKSDKDLKLVDKVKATALNDDKKLKEILDFIKSLKLNNCSGYKVAVEALKENNVKVNEVNAPMLNA